LSLELNTNLEEYEIEEILSKEWRIINLHHSNEESRHAKNNFNIKWEELNKENLLEKQ
jgi:hypothetical protein